MKHVPRFAIPLCAVAVALGCQESVRMGTVVRTGLRPGNEDAAPAIPVRPAEGGEVRTLGSIGYPFYVVGFVEAAPSGPCHVDERLRSLADCLTLDSVVIAQVVQPTQQMMLTDDPASKCPISEPRMLMLYDPERLAWEAFGRPDHGTAYLVDRNGYIVATGHTGDMSAILEEADRLQREWQRGYSPVTDSKYLSIYTD
jgi:hypothetical protein